MDTMNEKLDAITDLLTELIARTSTVQAQLEELAGCGPTNTVADVYDKLSEIGYILGYTGGYDGT